LQDRHEDNYAKQPAWPERDESANSLAKAVTIISLRPPSGSATPNRARASRQPPGPVDCHARHHANARCAGGYHTPPYSILPYSPYGKSILQIAARAIALNLLGREDNPLGEWPIRWPDRTPAAEATFMNQGWVSSPPIAPSVRTDNHFRVSA
jgi:hypothetical protein